MRNPDHIIHDAIRTAHAAGQQQALTGVFAALGRTLAAQLNILPAAPAHAKAHEHVPHQSDPDLEADPHAALLLAQIDHQIRCREANTDAGPGDRALHALWHDPEALAAVLSPHVHDDPQFAKAVAYALFLKAAEHSPKGGFTTGGKFYPGGQWIPASVVAAATPEEKTELAERKAGARLNPLNKREKASAAAAEKRGTRDETRKRVAQIATEIMLHPHTRTPDMYRDLADAIRGPHLSVPDLRALRLKLSASFGGGRRKEQMVAALLQHAEAETHDLNNPQPEPPALPGVPKPPKAPKPGSIAILKTDSLSLDPARFQFKLRTNAEGVTAALKNAKGFKTKFAGVIAVWFDPEKNATFVVNGHHRYDLARRFGHPQLAVYYIDAKDARQARAEGALINIAEGRGTAIDAAKFLRDSGRGPQDLFDAGISPDEPVARDAAVLSKLNDAAFDRLARGGLNLRTALAVAKHVEDPARQEKLFKLIAKKEESGEKFTQKHVEEMARQMAAAPSATTTSSGLFGDIAEEDDAFTERADLASHVRSELAKEHHDYGALSSERRAGATADAGNVLNVEENRKRADAAEVHKHAYDTLAHRKGPVSDALDAGAVAIKQARTKKEKERVRSETLARVRSAVADAAAGRVPADGPGVGADRGEHAEGAASEQGVPVQARAGGDSADGRGAGDGEAGVKPLPSVADIVAHPEQAAAAPEATSSPNATPSAASAVSDAAPAAASTGGPAEPVSPLRQLAHFAHNPAALKAESEKLSDLANKTSAQGGSLEFHDAMTAALRGEHGPDVRDAVSRALDDWDSHKGSTAKRYARVAEEVAKLGAQEEPQAEAKEDAPAATTEKEVKSGADAATIPVREVRGDGATGGGAVQPGDGEVRRPGGDLPGLQRGGASGGDSRPKQAHETARREWIASLPNTPAKAAAYLNSLGVADATVKRDASKSYPSYYVASGSRTAFGASPGVATAKWLEDHMPRESHKRQVELALEGGKSVPPEVLADYPGLSAIPQAEAKEDAPAPAESQPAVTAPEAKPESLGKKKLSPRGFEGRADDAAPTDEEFAAASKPAASADASKIPPPVLASWDAAEKSLTPAERERVAQYTDSPVAFNGPLHAGRPSDAKHAQRLKELDGAIAKAPPFTEPVTLHRGFRLKAGDAQGAAFVASLDAAAASGDTVNVPGYMSASANPEVANRFGGSGAGGETPVAMEVVANRGLFADPASAHGNPLKEVILPRGGTYRVTKREEGGKSVYRLEQMPPAESQAAKPLPSVADVTANPAAHAAKGEEAAKPAAKPAAEPATSSPNASAGRGASASAAPAAPAAPANPSYTPASREEERHAYAAKSARAITATPDMTRDEKAAAAKLAPLTKPSDTPAPKAAEPSSNGTGGSSIPSGKPPKESSSPNAEPELPAEVKHGATAHHVPAILAIPKGDSRYIAGFRVRHTPEGNFQIERKGQHKWEGGKHEIEGGFQTGTAKQIGELINDQWRDIAGFKSLSAALARASAYEEPDPFTDLARADSDAKARSATPDGTRAVSLDDHTRGRVGTVRHDAETGNTWLQFDGSEEERGRDFEPLNDAHSWRAGKGAKAKRAKTESLFGG